MSLDRKVLIILNHNGIYDVNTIEKFIGLNNNYYQVVINGKIVNLKIPGITYSEEILTEELLDEIKDEIKDEILDEVVNNEVEIKDEIKDEILDEVKDDIFVVSETVSYEILDEQIVADSKKEEIVEREFAENILNEMSVIEPDKPKKKIVKKIVKKKAIAKKKTVKKPIKNL